MAAAHINRSEALSLKRLAVSTSTLALLAIALAPTSSRAQDATFNGTQSTSGPFTYGQLTFLDDSVMNANAADALTLASSALFHDNSTLNVTAANAISAHQTFYDNAKLNANVANGIKGGLQYFYGHSILNANVADAVSAGEQHFYENSVLNARAAGSISQHNLYFDDNSVLNASAGAIGSGLQFFSGSSVLKALGISAVGSGAQTFAGSSQLQATVADAVTGAQQDFSGLATLSITARGAVTGGRQRFYNVASLVAAGSHAVGGTSEQQFYDSSLLAASAADAISDGTQSFHSSSRLDATVGGAVSGGQQIFNDSALLNAMTPAAVSGGERIFYGSSMLNAGATGAVSGGTQMFTDSSKLYVGADNALTNAVRVHFGYSGYPGAPVPGSGGVLSLNGFNTVVGGLDDSNDLFGTLNEYYPGAGVVENGGTGNSILTVDSSVVGDSAFSGQLRDGAGGTLSLVKTGAGKLVLGGDNTYTGSTTVSSGELQLNGSLSGAVMVENSGTLSTGVTMVNGVGLGNGGWVTNSVTIAAGGTLAGSSGLTLGMDSLTLDPGARVNVSLGAPSTTALFNVTGALRLDGTLNVSNAGGFGNGLYRLFDAGSVIDNGLAIGATPGGYAAGDLSIQATANQVNLLVGSVAPGSYTFWDGPNNTANGTVDGGTGTWSDAGTNWTDVNGSVNSAYDPTAMLIFQGAPGTVTVPLGSALDIGGGMQFFVDGYTVTGPGALYLTAATTFLRVGDGTAAGAGMTATIASTLAGSGGIDKTDLGTLVLSGINTYTGGTTVSAGTLKLVSDGTLGSWLNPLTIASGATLDLGGTSQTVGELSGGGTITSTALTGNTARLTVNQNYSTDNTTFSGALVEQFDEINGAKLTMGLTKSGLGTLTLTGNNAYTGTTDILGGTLIVDGTLGNTYWGNIPLGNSQVNVVGGALGGAGSIAGDVSVGAGAILLGRAGQTLSMGSLTLNADAIVDVALGAPGNARLFNVIGALTLDGTLNVSGAGGFGNGLYRLFDAGSVIDNGLTIGTTPSGYAAGDLSVQTSAHQVNLLVGSVAPGSYTFWDGPNTAADNVVNGGTGTWSATGTNWTNAGGAANGVYGPSAMLIFAGTPGTVTVDAAGGTLPITGGLQFFVDGYKVTGQALNLAAAATPIRVGDGTAGGASMSATIASALTGSGGLDKIDLGTLILSGISTYTGATTISAGTLKFDADLGGALGAPTGALAIAGGGTFDLTGTNQTVGALSGAGSITSSVYGGRQSSLTVNQVTNTGYGGAITDGYMTGAGDGTVWLIKDGTGALTLTGNSRFAFTSVNGGTLAIANGGTVKNETSYIGEATGSNGTVLVTGSGSLWTMDYLKLGYRGAGTLTIADGGKVSLGVGTVDMVSASSTSATLNLNATAAARGVLETQAVRKGLGGARVNFNGGILRATTADADLLGNFVAGDVTFNAGGAFIDSNGYQVEISAPLGGVGALTKQGAGELYVIGANTYQGGTTIEAGRLFLGDGGTLGATTGSLFVAGGATLDLGITSQTVGSLAGAGTVTSTVMMGNPSRLTVDQAADTIFSGSIANGVYVASPGTGGLPAIIVPTVVGLTKAGNGTLTLSGSNNYTGDTNVTGGTLLVDGALGDTQVAIAPGAALGGAGTISGDVSVASGGILSGRTGQTLSLAALALDAGSVVDVTLGAPSTTRLFNIVGDLTLNGTLNVANAGGFGDGLYRLFDYGGAMSGSGLAIGATPAGYTAGDLTVQTSVAHQVNLIAASGPYIFWDGANTVANGTVDGGSGVWSATGTNWTNTNATGNGAYDRATRLIFAGAPGTITVDAAGAGSLEIGPGLQFANDGFVMQGDGLSLNGSGVAIRVGDGTAAGAGMAATIASALTGSSGLDKTDLGTLILAGANSYRGGTTISGGTLAITATGGITSDVANGATFRNAGTVAGSVTNNAGATFIQTGGSVSNGLVNAGAVNADGGALSGVIANNAGGSFMVGGPVTSNSTFNNANGATLTIGATGGYTIGGLLTNNGTLTVAGGGTLTVPAGIHNNAGGVITNNGTITDALDNAGLVTNSGTYNADVATNTGTINNSVGAFWNGNFNTAGIVNNDGTINGSLAQSSGTTINQGTITSTVTVTGGLFTGAGRIGGLTVGTGATLAPGMGGIGTLNVAGNINFMAGSVYEVEANAAGQADRIVAAGNVSIAGGTVKVLAGAGNYRPQTDYTILTAAGGVTGTFTNVSSNLAFLDPTLRYDGSNVYLRLRRNDISFAGIGLTPNQKVIGDAIEKLGWSNPVFDAVINLSAPQAQNAFDQLSGEIHPSVHTAMIEDSRFVRGAVWNRLRAASGDSGRGVWGQAIGSWGHTGGDNNAARLDRSAGGLLMGLDEGSESVRLGAVWGYDHTDIDVSARGSSGKLDSFHLGGYLAGQWNSFAIRTGIAYSWSDIHTTRNVALPGFRDTARAGYNGGTFQVFGEVANNIDLGRTNIEPYTNVAYVRARTSGFSETGGAAKLSGTRASTDVTFTTLGLRTATGFDLGSAHATLRAGAGWRHAFGDATPVTAMRLSAGVAPFAITGLPVTRDTAALDAGLDIAISGHAAIGLSYTGQAGRGLSDQTARANISFRF